jgi:hypothetical protein
MTGHWRLKLARVRPTGLFKLLVENHRAAIAKAGRNLQKEKLKDEGRFIMNSTLRYNYNLPWRGVAIGTVFYAGLSVFVAHLARDFSGLIFVCLIALSMMFAVLAFIVMIRRIVFPRALELTEDAILFPHGFPRTRITRIPYSDVIRLSNISLRGPGSLYMVTARGSFEIGSVRFPDIENYHAARDFIFSKTLIVRPRQDERERLAWRMGGFPNPILRWVEPKDWPRYRTHLVVSKPLLPRLAKALWFFVRCFGIILLPWLLLQFFQLPTMSVAGFLGLSIPVTFFFASLYWLYATYPAHSREISFRDKGITVSNGKQTADWNYHDCSGWAVIERQFEGRTLYILLLKRRAYVGAYAIPDMNTRDQLVQICNDKKIQQLPDLKPSWESSV